QRTMGHHVPARPRLDIEQAQVSHRAGPLRAELDLRRRRDRAQKLHVHLGQQGWRLAAGGLLFGLLRLRGARGGPDQSRKLRQRLADEYPRNRRPTGKVPREEVLVAGDLPYARGPLPRREFAHLAEEHERRPVRQAGDDIRPRAPLCASFIALAARLAHAARRSSMKRASDPTEANASRDNSSDGILMPKSFSTAVTIISMSSESRS